MLERYVVIRLCDQAKVILSNQWAWPSRAGFFDLINSSLPAGQVGALIACISSRIITVNSTHRTPPAWVRASGGPAARPGLLPGPLCFVGYRGLSPVQAALDARVRLPHLRGKCLGPGQDGPRRRSLARPRPAWPWQGRGILGMAMAPLSIFFSKS